MTTLHVRFVLMTALCFAALLFTPAISKAGWRVEPHIIECGVLAGDASAFVELTIVNDAAESLRLEKIRSSCPCLTHELPLPQDIPGGGSLRLLFTLDAGQLPPGAFTKYLFFHCADTRHPLRSATIQGQVAE